MSLKFFHQVIIFAAIGISLVFGIWCFTDPSVAGDVRYRIAGVVSGFVIGALIAYEFYFLKKTRRLIVN
jgi:membrane protease YdiL (CAAX protease family)